MRCGCSPSASAPPRERLAPSEEHDSRPERQQRGMRAVLRDEQGIKDDHLNAGARSGCLVPAGMGAGRDAGLRG